MEKILNKRTNRMIKRGTQAYRNALKAGDLDLTEPTPPPTPEPEPEPEIEPEPETFDESKLQIKLVELSTDMIQKNMKKIVKAQKLSDQEMDSLIKKMLYQKLCIDEPEPKKAKPKKAKKKSFKVVQPSSSKSSESD